MKYNAMLLSICLLSTQVNSLAISNYYSHTNSFNVTGIPIPGANDLYYVKWAKQFYLRIILKNEVGVKKLLGDLYDLLAEKSIIMKGQGFFPENNPEYREMIIGRQVPFFIEYFKGKLTQETANRIAVQHFRNEITSEMFDEMKYIIVESFREMFGDYITNFVVDPGSTIEEFRPMIVKSSVHLE